MCVPAANKVGGSVLFDRPLRRPKQCLVEAAAVLYPSAREHRESLFSVIVAVAAPIRGRREGKDAAVVSFDSLL
jgi:hypothetical protein